MSRYNFELNQSGWYLPIEAGGGSIDLTYENTCLYTHAAPYRDVDHVYFERESELGGFVFRITLPDFSDLAVQLIEKDYPRIHRPYPDKHDYEIFEGVRDAKNVEVIEEVEDEDEVERAMANLDEEYDYLLGEYDA